MKQKGSDAVAHLVLTLSRNEGMKLLLLGEYIFDRLSGMDYSVFEIQKRNVRMFLQAVYFYTMRTTHGHS